jgi:hypothetical protein
MRVIHFQAVENQNDSGLKLIDCAATPPTRVCKEGAKTQRRDGVLAPMRESVMMVTLAFASESGSADLRSHLRAFVPSRLLYIMTALAM